MSRAEITRGKDMGFTRISNASLNSRGATTLPNQPQISAAALKQEFDAPAKNVVAPAVNNLMDELEASTSAGNIGAVAPTGRTGSTTQGVINSISGDLATLEASAGQAIADAHTHANKALLDDYTQTETDLADAVSKKHDHSNKSLLDTYTQTESNIADAVSKKHDHSNKSLLDSYTQTETDLADAVSKKHAHTNLALLETYTQTNADIAQAVTDDHTHSNKTVLDKFGESSGNPTYDGNPIGGGGSGDTFKTIQSAGTSFVASGEDTFKINAGSNVTITALSSPDKGISISATGGGQSTGDMLMTDYDSQGDVKTAGGIDAYVTAQIGALDVSDSAVSGQYVTAVSETDGKISVSRTSLPAIPTITDTYSGTSSDGMSGKAVKSAIDALDVSDTAVSGQYVSAVSETDGKISVTRANLPTAPAYDMIDNSDLFNEMATALTEGTTNDDVVSAYGVGTWANTECIIIYTTLTANTDTIGSWNDTWQTDGVRTGWIWHSLLYNIIADDKVEIKIVSDISGGEVLSLNAYRIDDNVQNSGTDGGAIAIKFNNKPSANTVIGVKLIRQRTQKVPAMVLS